MAKIDAADYTSFQAISDRLDELVAEVKNKDTSLERSLDIYDEAIALGSKAINLVDTPDPSSMAGSTNNAKSGE
ncbi:MAG: exodeoxyribonuclease VII small subunit [Coriobacteriaceae bacterium]|nr:MAG: exodeoxyribonuclease VII small subunit [Coriobacteriaceae bacterium]